MNMVLAGTIGPAIRARIQTKQNYCSLKISGGRIVNPCGHPLPPFHYPVDLLLAHHEKEMNISIASEALIKF